MAYIDRRLNVQSKAMLSTDRHRNWDRAFGELGDWPWNSGMHPSWE